ncbi:flagellar biosynthetic protein FliR, partial [Salmonella enterica subsp. enterica serovar Montevideo]|nr:flagellar biosynthetic protein FliR [Salmonella enterica subsp. enterica serovar Montevideo]
TLLLTLNLALGLLNRMAPQLSIFVIGFPLTLTVGIMLMAALMHKRKQAAHSFRKHGLTTTTRSELRAARSQKISTDEYGVRF